MSMYSPSLTERPRGEEGGSDGRYRLRGGSKSGARTKGILERSWVKGEG